MVYISNWQEYQVAAEKLYETSPTTVCSPRLLYSAILCIHPYADTVLLQMETVRKKTRVEDHRQRYSQCPTQPSSTSTYSQPRQCLKFKTYSSIFLNRFEALNLSLMEKMQNRQPERRKPTSLIPKEESQPPALPPIQATSSTPGGVKKKKPKKKK